MKATSRAKKAEIIDKILTQTGHQDQASLSAPETPRPRANGRAKTAKAVDSVETVAEVVRHYASLDPVSLHAKDGRPAKPLNLTAREQTDLVVFLQSLSTFSNPWRPDDGGQCD